MDPGGVTFRPLPSGDEHHDDEHHDDEHHG
jgi:hypothetical protein